METQKKIKNQIINPVWKINSIHKKILKELFCGFKQNNNYNILDAGSGRTSLQFLTNHFYKSKINAVIHPNDFRKKQGINQNIKAKNFTLQEVNFHKYSSKHKFDIVLAHLLLGEASKFSKEPFENMLESLFKIKTDFLIIVDIIDDPEVDYRILLKFIAKQGQIQKIVCEDKYIGFLLRKKK